MLCLTNSDVNQTMSFIYFSYWHEHNPKWCVSVRNTNISGVKSMVYPSTNIWSILQLTHTLNYCTITSHVHTYIHNETIRIGLLCKHTNDCKILSIRLVTDTKQQQKLEFSGQLPGIQTYTYNHTAVWLTMRKRIEMENPTQTFCSITSEKLISQSRFQSGLRVVCGCHMCSCAPGM